MNGKTGGDIIKITKINSRKPLKLKNVAAYARVSTSKDVMLHSLAAQIDHYQKYITNHAGWHFCGVFADTAQTGTKDNCEKFQKLLNLCRKGEIDLIITKSISRFARNTVTLLETVRELEPVHIKSIAIR